MFCSLLLNTEHVAWFKTILNMQEKLMVTFETCEINKACKLVNVLFETFIEIMNDPFLKRTLSNDMDCL